MALDINKINCHFVEKFLKLGRFSSTTSLKFTVNKHTEGWPRLLQLQIKKEG